MQCPDNLRGCPPADHVGAYGYPRNTIPHIDSFAKEGFVFQNAFAVRSQTWPSLTSMLTAKYPVSTGVRQNGELMDVDLRALGGLLREENYPTAAFLPNFCEAGREDFAFRQCGDDASITISAVEWLKRNKEGDFFLWIHPLNPLPYAPQGI
ncbi:MAG: sulfatase-like hydrolase/transferase [Candidatus Altiarchaeota archaeon]